MIVNIEKNKSFLKNETFTLVKHFYKTAPIMRNTGINTLHIATFCDGQNN